jgi:hypothetical protein
MIGFERSTKNERDVLAAALRDYDDLMVERLSRTTSLNPDADAEWRHHQAIAVLEQLRRQ